MKMIRATAVIWSLTAVVFWVLYQVFARLYERFVPITPATNIVAFVIVVVVIIPGSIAARNWVIHVIKEDILPADARAPLAVTKPRRCPHRDPFSC